MADPDQLDLLTIGRPLQPWQRTWLRLVLDLVDCTCGLWHAGEAECPTGGEPA